MFVIIFTVCYLIGVGILNGWAMATLWNWFVAPTFHIPTLSIQIAWGISILVHLFNNDIETKKANDTEELVGKFIFYLLSPLLAVGTGWLVLKFM